ncbi:hypothetical protein EDB89DRAFT_1295277 [Lactarius sanguifluus]|nr:hypothetical protein EDB89DRAFT_1295277 [Lactarius sanguifluus]
MIPPHLKESPEIRFAGAFDSGGRTKTARGAILFSDFSMCWYLVTYGSGPPACWARFQPRPEPMSAATLRHAADARRGGSGICNARRRVQKARRPWRVLGYCARAAPARCAPRDARS